MGSEIQLYSKINDPIAACQQLGTWFGTSGMFGFSKVEQGMVAAFAMMTEGLTPFEFKARYHVTPSGDIIPKAHHVLAEFIRNGGKFEWIKDGEDGQAARLKLEFKDRKPVEYEYTIKMAERAGLLKDKSGWLKDPGKQLRARCETGGVAMICPEIVTKVGIVDDEEIPAATVTVSAPLFPNKPATTMAAAPTIDVQIVPEAEKALTETPPAEYVHTPPKVEIGADGRITPATLQIFVQMCQARGNDFDAKVFKWLTDKNKIKANDLLSIAPKFLQDVFNMWPQFVARVEEDTLAQINRLEIRAAELSR